MDRFRFASERRGGTYAHNGENEQSGREADGIEESVNNENVDKENRERNT
jgi:hypothetical protein